MHNSDPLIHTKLCLPFIRPSRVTRPRLQEQILHGLRGPLTLIIAPAGFGKTTLAAACVIGHGMPVAWLSLDKNDNQIERFLDYLIAALHEADETIGNDAAQIMAEMQQVSLETVLTSLINDLDSTGRELILVLDDYQFINSQAVHQAVGFLLEHCPNTLHMVIATRADPPLPLARLRVRGQMVEFRAADLRFTAAEAAQFLNDIMGLSLDAGSVAVLEERTEGWVAGLQMAALSIRGRDAEHVGDFIQAFAGTNRFIMDFMLAEVLAREPEAVQAFLVQTAILTRLSGSLCDTILGTSDGQKILEMLERHNLFVIPLDDKGCWYRYHHLFADLLRAQLDQLYPGDATRLHSLAATWYENNGFNEDAIQHALAAGDYPGAARLVETVAENAWLNGQYASILAWTKAIPEEVLQRRPWLCIWNAWAHTQMGVSRAIDQWITTAEQAIRKQDEDVSSITSRDASQVTQALITEILALRAFAVSFSKDYDQAIELAESVLKRPPLKNKKVAQFTRCNILHLLSSMYYATGNLLKAEQSCQETIELAKEMGFTLRHLHAINKLVLVNRANGHLYRSCQLIEDTLSMLESQGFNNYFAVSQLFLRKMEILYEWNQLDEFQHLVESTLRQELLVDVPYLQVDIYNLQALDLLHQRDYPKVQDVLNRAKALARQSYIWEGLTWRMESLQMKLWMQKGDLSQAIAWNSQRTVGHDHINRFSIESYEVSQARILLAQNAVQEMLSLLDRLANSAEVEGRKGSLIEIRSLKAIALLGLQELDQATAEVESALALAEPEGFVRTFLDEGHPMQILLSHVANSASSPYAKYALRLLTAFQEEQGSTTAMIQLPLASSEEALGPDISNAALIEPLSRRELEVLHLMSLGRSNQEIAQQLIVAPGTVKAHTASIYRKLNVTNRTEAAARARHLGILP